MDFNTKSTKKKIQCPSEVVARILEKKQESHYQDTSGVIYSLTQSLNWEAV
jgi:hypothetical protein